ncbi:MAG: UDP-N-acetylmuramoylalanyl-D-glutamyl-2,6-diaminopimelate--D-alanyl-D-alanine ligase [Proteobacteria bacterium]|nr:UDP-N-acetylmuramoylalanyl-D-glutamyl-2,6-diaminopimelate--D-alanyl-D-alanine ligase [Pseudomonadota bacterium]
MSSLWTSAEMEAATLGRATRAFEATGISIDTRTLRPGDLFVALKGEARDGHDFVKAALDAKACAALVARQPEGVNDNAPLLTVAHTQRGLEDLGRASRTRSNAKIIAVTGSAGKTTTKEMLRYAFGALGRTHASSASYNNHWGVPLSLSLLPRDAQYGVFEIGMNHFGEIRSLVGFVRPHVALVTAIAPAHLEFFGTCEAIADAKSEIFEGIKPGGAALLPSDSPYTDRLAARARQAGVARILTFGEKMGSDARLVAMDETDGGMKIESEILGRPVHFRIGAPGAHIARNALGALLAVGEAEGDVLNAAAALSQFSALKGRGARFTVKLAREIGGGSAEVIDESYNANPASMTAALALLGSAKARRRIAVLGDMLEMGPQGTAHHAALASDIAAARVDLVFANGAQMQALWDALPQARRGAYGAKSSDIASKVTETLRDGDVVLVKGSLGSRMAVIVDALKARGGSA